MKTITRIINRLAKDGLENVLYPTLAAIAFAGMIFVASYILGLPGLLYINELKGQSTEVVYWHDFLRVSAIGLIHIVLLVILWWIFAMVRGAVRYVKKIISEEI